MEGGLSSRMQVMETLNVFTDAYDGVLRAFEALDTYYETREDSGNLRALSDEMEAIEEDFNEVEGIVKGYLSGASRSSVRDRTETSVRDQAETKQLREEISKREEELSKIGQEIEKAYADCKRQLAESLRSEKPPAKPDPVAGKRSEELQENPKSKESSREQNSNAQKQPVVSLPSDTPSTLAAVKKTSGLTPPSFTEVVYSSTPYAPFYSQIPVTSVTSAVEQHLHFQQSSSVPPIIPVGSSVNHSYPLPFSSTPSSSAYVPSSSRQLPFSGGQAYSMYTGSNQPFSMSTSDQISADSSALLKKVSVPRFFGQKKNYEAWKAAFYSCVDRTKATPEYKLLRLRECLQGEPLKVIENLGHSAAAYEAAKSRLERKYGGKRRALTLRLEELNSFKPVREDNEKDLERFSELLEGIVVNLKDANQEAELGDGSLYITLQRKFNKSLLSKYKQWVSDNHRTENVKTLREFVDRESEFLTTASETISGVLKEPFKKDKKIPSVEQTFVTQDPLDHKKKSSRKCKVCKGQHGVWACESFLKMSVAKRWEVATGQKLCFRCLADGHRGEACLRSRVCGLNGCTSTHHRMLHEDKTDDKTSRNESAVGSDLSSTSVGGAADEGEIGERTHVTTTTMKLTAPSEFMALRTVPVYLTNGSKQVKVNALLDEGSSRSYLNSDVAAELGLEGRPQELTVNVLNDNQEKLNSLVVEFTISSLDGTVRKLASAYTTRRVTGSMHVVDWNRYKSKWKHLKALKFPQVGPRPIVDLLIGVDLSDLLYSIEDVRGGPGEPIARLTPLGWTCIGNPQLNAGRAQTNFAFFVKDSHELNTLVRRFWEIEEPGKKIQIVKPEEKRARDAVTETLRLEDGHYSVGLPWKTKDPELPDNFQMALRRLQNTEKRLQKSPELAKAYSDVLQTYQDKGYIRKVSPGEKKPDQVWYLPHFPVLRPDKSTTKTRVVFDASAKYGEVSLNDVLLQGPKLQNDLFDVLLRFRRDPVALMCDIREMYLQIKLEPSDRPYHRFLWRDLNDEQDPDVFEFERVVFGVNSSPFLAQFVIQEHARKHQSEFPLGAETVLKSTYMDDSMDSVPDKETGIELYRELSQLWALAGMHARKWLSNVPEVLECIPHADCVTEVDLDRGELPVVKTLGVLWSPSEDEFKYQVHQPNGDHTSTKRAFLKGIATLFDPLGFLAPYVIRAKIVLQEMWESGVDWDDPVPEALSRKAQQWFEELSELPRLCIPRCLRTGTDVRSITLHTFVDASQEAYGAATYSRHLYEDGTVTCRLVASKSRVAPVQAVSIPRLELMAAVVGLRLAETVGSVLNIPKHDWLFWSDSEDVLYWIRGRSRKFKPFVANRVGEIQSLTDPEQWRHVPTKQNPADLLTRGLSVSALTEAETWWKGPVFLVQEETEWPEKKLKFRVEPDIEVRKQYQGESEQVTTFLSTSKEDRLDPTRYSSWTRLTRLFATVNRFIENCRLPLTLRKKGTLRPDEIVTSEMQLIRLAQQEEFQEEIRALKSGRELPGKSKLLSLKPMLDEEGMLRCDGRLTNADCLPWETRHPIILPRNHQTTKLIIKDSHEKNQHGGTNQVLAQLSSRYWIVSAREAIREWEKECMVCRRRKVTPAKQVMAPLPDLRTQKSLRAFSQTSVDFAGPFYTKQGRGKTRY